MLSDRLAARAFSDENKGNRAVEGNEKMNDLQPGDRIDIVFVDAPGHTVRATVNRFLSDEQEGLSPEAKDYIFYWMEISPEHQGTLAPTIVFGADWKYYMDGREVKICKCLEQAS